MQAMERTMSMFHITADRLSTPLFRGISPWSHIESIARAASRSLSEWRRQVRERHELMMLNKLELRDILLNKSDVRVAARKWFWQA